MNISKHLFRASVASSLAIGLWAISIAGSNAANVVFFPNADISVMPYVLSLDGGAATRSTPSSTRWPPAAMRWWIRLWARRLLSSKTF
jgi:hypothetical protein